MCYFYDLVEFDMTVNVLCFLMFTLTSNLETEKLFFLLTGYSHVSMKLRCGVASYLQRNLFY